MSQENKPVIGAIGWTDLTVENAEEIRDFYKQIVGWKVTSVPMGQYEDFCMNRPQDGETVAGICHARGGNADLPAQWLIYINVADLDRSAARCVELGGKVIAGPKEMGGHGRYCVIQDPAGAVCTLFEPEETE